jgi:hypothetical protein
VRGSVCVYSPDHCLYGRKASRKSERTAIGAHAHVFVIQGVASDRAACDERLGMFHWLTGDLIAAKRRATHQLSWIACRAKVEGVMPGGERCFGCSESGKRFRRTCAQYTVVHDGSKLILTLWTPWSVRRPLGQGAAIRPQVQAEGFVIQCMGGRRGGKESGTCKRIGFSFAAINGERPCRPRAQQAAS